MLNRFVLEKLQGDFSFKKMSRLFLCMNAAEMMKSSALYQHTVVTKDNNISKEMLGHFKKAVIAKVSGHLDLAKSRFSTILNEKEMNNGLRAECHFQLGEILCYMNPEADEGIRHMVACRTLEERHFNAVYEIERQRPVLDKFVDKKNTPRILLVLGSNAATVAFANSFMKERPIAGLIQQYIKYPVLPLKFQPKKNDLPFGLAPGELRSFKNEGVLGNQWNVLFMDHDVPRIFIGRGEINGEDVLEWVKKLKIDLIVSHGPERLSGQFLKLAKHGGINVHWGLSPTYRGMDTARWPLFQKKPEWIGVTIHKLDEGLDSGPIIYQCRPELKYDYTFRMIEYSLTMLACKIMPAAVTQVLSGNVKLTHQNLSKGTQYKADWWTRKHQNTLTSNYIAQQLCAYLNNKTSRDRSVELINPWTSL